MKRQLTRFAFMSNPYRVIKLLVFVTGFCIVSCTTALAQQSLFVYLQSENWQPFYVQIGEKVYSSSSIGHLVLSNLSDNTCSFEVGFPQHTIQPQRFSIPLQNRDHGYQLIKNGSKGYALQDWQTDEIIKPLKDAGNTTILYGERKNDDPFANLMAAVVNDSSVLYTSIVKKENTAVPTVASADNKPAEKQEVKVEEKAAATADSAITATKEQHVDVVTARIPPPPPPVETANLAKTNVTVDTAQAQNVTAVDTAVVKYDPKERGLTDKAEKPAGVAKVQQQTKDGQTKMVFVDSSETPVKVVTVYIEDDKKAADTPAAVEVTKPQPQQQVVLPSVKQEMQVEVVTNNNNAVVKKDTVKAAPVTKDEVAEQIKKETWSTTSTPEKKASTTDTATIILESSQMKKATTEEPQPLYRPKEEKKVEPAKPVVEETPKAIVTQPVIKEEKVEEKQEPVKPAETKKESEPVQVKTEKEPAKPTVDSAVAVVKTEPQPSVEVKKPEAEKPKTVEPEKKAEPTSKLVMINSDCVKLATDNDVDKLRVKMMAESDLQKKLTVANKYFKTMCLYAKQIKGLSELFPNDEGRYKFLELAYPFAADTANFKQLHELLSEEVYVTKFKKLVRLQ